MSVKVKSSVQPWTQLSHLSVSPTPPLPVFPPTLPPCLPLMASAHHCISLLKHLEEICPHANICCCCYCCVWFNPSSSSPPRTNWSLGLPAVLADLPFCLPLSGSFSFSPPDAVVSSLIQTLGKQQHKHKDQIKTTAEMFFVCFRESSSSHWLTASSLVWLTWPCLALAHCRPLNDPSAVNVNDGRRARPAPFCYLSCTYCLDTPLSLDTHFQGGPLKRARSRWIEEISRDGSRPQTWRGVSPAQWVENSRKPISLLAHPCIFFALISELDVVGVRRRGYHQRAAEQRESTPPLLHRTMSAFNARRQWQTLEARLQYICSFRHSHIDIYVLTHTHAGNSPRHSHSCCAVDASSSVCDGRFYCALWAWLSEECGINKVVVHVFMSVVNRFRTPRLGLLLHLLCRVCPYVGALSPLCLLWHSTADNAALKQDLHERHRGGEWRVCHSQCVCGPALVPASGFVGQFGCFIDCLHCVTKLWPSPVITFQMMWKRSGWNMDSCFRPSLLIFKKQW